MALFGASEPENPAVIECPYCLRQFASKNWEWEIKGSKFSPDLKQCDEGSATNGTVVGLKPVHLIIKVSLLG